MAAVATRPADPPGPAPVDALLAAFGVRLDPPAPARHPDLEWARSGSMTLCGTPDAPPRLAPAPLASRAVACVAALRDLAGGSTPLDGLDGAALLGERAAVFGLERRGAMAPGGTCRLLRAADGWLVLNLARPDDVAALPAWLETRVDAERDVAWRDVEATVAARPVRELEERARWLGLPAAAATAPRAPFPAWAEVARHGEPRVTGAAPRVLDLSALWAGPLCTHLLGLAGASVVKLESPTRPDGARAGPRAFFDLLNAGKRSVSLDLGTAAGRDALRRLVAGADVVVEASRPRALRQLGVDAEAWVAAAPGRTWVSITGYGRHGASAERVAFGDDAAAAAGLAVVTGSEEGPLFCGDAIADPLAGLHAAVAALASHRAGGGRLVSVALRDGVAHLLGRSDGVREARVEAAGAELEVRFAGRREPVRAPRARTPAARARPLGADTEAVLREVGAAC